MNTNNFIKTLESLNVSKEELAKKIGIDRATLYRKLAKGGETFTLKEVHAIANVLKLNVSEVAEILLNDAESHNERDTCTIGGRLRALRIKNNKTLDDVAFYVGVTRQTLFKYERGLIENIPLQNIGTLATYFNVSPSYLVGWEEMNRKEEKTMLYVKKKFHEGTADEIEVKFDLYDDEIYCICPECGKEVQLDKENLIAILEDGDFAHSALLCKDCSQKIVGD